MNTTSIEIPQRKHRLSPEQIEALVAEYKVSGPSCRAFAKEAGIGVGSLYCWLRVTTQGLRVPCSPPGKPGYSILNEIYGPILNEIYGRELLPAGKPWVS